MRLLLKALTALFTDQWEVVWGMDTADVADQVLPLLVGVRAIGPLASGVNDGATDVFIGKVQL